MKNTNHTSTDAEPKVLYVPNININVEDASVRIVSYTTLII